MSGATPTIAIAPVGWADAGIMAHLRPVLEAAFARRVVTVGTVRLPAGAFRAERAQWLATDVLDAVAAARGGCERILGIASVDLFVPDLNFVFGVADEARSAALFSLARLGARREGERTRRAETEAVHELGHAYGLGHCRDPRCVMWFSNTLAETDRKGARFCALHGVALQRAIAGA